MDPERTCIIFRSNVMWLEAVQGVAEDLGLRLGFDDDGRFAISMALREGINNAIIHGNQRDASKAVEVEFLSYEDRLEIRVRDEGRGFDRAKLPDPLDPQNLLRPSGRGVFLIKHYMDTVDLARSARRGGEIRMIKWLPGRVARDGSEPRAL